MTKNWEKFMREFEETGVITVSEEVYDELVEMLNEPPKPPSDKLIKIMNTSAPWETKGNTENDNH